jgi:hypothetical protein
MLLIEDMLEDALWPGGKAKTEEMQMRTGTKDKTAQVWTNQLLAQVQKAWADDLHCLDDNIANKLGAWLHAQPGKKINPLLNLVGTSQFSCLGGLHWMFT